MMSLRPLEIMLEVYPRKMVHLALDASGSAGSAGDVQVSIFFTCSMASARLVAWNPVLRYDWNSLV